MRLKNDDAYFSAVRTLDCENEIAPYVLDFDYCK